MATRQSVADAWGLELDPVDSTAWLTAAEVAELLGSTRSTVGQWRDLGRFGAEGVGWCMHGKRFRYSVDAVEALEQAGTRRKRAQSLAS